MYLLRTEKIIPKSVTPIGLRNDIMVTPKYYGSNP